jgi:GNAT superfamily N-acetyltransferase
MEVPTPNVGVPESERLTPEPPDDPAVGPPMIEALEAVERCSLLDMVDAAPQGARRRLGLQVEHRRGIVAVRSAALDSLLFNRVFLSSSQGFDPDDLDAVLRSYEVAGIRRFWVHLPPGAARSRVPDWLDARGIRPYRRHWVKFLRGTEPPPRASSDLRVRCAERRDANAFGAILARAFDVPEAAIPLWAGTVGRPGWHTFVACDGERPVASGALFLHGSVGNLAGGATLPSHRRRGAQGALLAARLSAARAAGCTYVCSETGVRMPGEPNASYRNMVRAGLRPVYLRENYAPEGTTWTPA